MYKFVIFGERDESFSNNPDWQPIQMPILNAEYLWDQPRAIRGFKAWVLSLKHPEDFRNLMLYRVDEITPGKREVVLICTA